MTAGDPPPSPERTPRAAAVGTELRAARRAAGLTQTEAARALGIAQTSVSALERGLYLPPEATWDRLVEVYGLEDAEATALWREVRDSRPLRGAAATGRSHDAWPVDAGACSRRHWFGALRSHHRLTRPELADRLGVTSGVLAKAEQGEGALPTLLKDPQVLRELAALGECDELALRAAWQPDEIAGIEGLIGLEGQALIDAAEDAVALLRWLLATGRTQTDIAAACGVSRPAVSQWLSGRTHPTRERCEQLVSLLR